MNLVLNDNWKEIYQDMKIPVETALGLAYRQIAHNVFKDVPYNKIFPQLHFIFKSHLHKHLLSQDNLQFINNKVLNHQNEKHSFITAFSSSPFNILVVGKHFPHDLFFCKVYCEYFYIHMAFYKQLICIGNVLWLVLSFM